MQSSTQRYYHVPVVPSVELVWVCLVPVRRPCILYARTGPLTNTDKIDLSHNASFDIGPSILICLVETRIDDAKHLHHSPMYKPSPTIISSTICVFSDYLSIISIPSPPITVVRPLVIASA